MAGFGWGPVSDRDRFFAWLKSEFAASNAIIDALMEHVRLTSGPTEFDDVVSRVQRRRSGWAAVLHMQQYVSVAEVTSALHRVQLSKERVEMENKSDELLVQSGEISNLEGSEKQKNVKILPKLFVSMTGGNCMTGGNSFNELEGLALYEDLLEESSVSMLVSFLHEMKDKGLNGELQGRTMLVSKRPMRGHARETLQFGLPITDGVLNEELRFDQTNSNMVEPIPSILQDVLDQIVELQILKEKPDYCTIDFLNEMDYLHPHFWMSWYGRPICTLFLTQCDVLFGRVLKSTPHYGDYAGSLRLSLSSGSLLVMQDKSVDVAKRAVPSQQKNRIIITFGKSQPLIEPKTFPSRNRKQPNFLSYNQAPPVYQNYTPCAFHPVMPPFMGNQNPGNNFPNPGNNFPNPGNCFPFPGTGVFLPHNGFGWRPVTEVPPVYSCITSDESVIQEVTGSGKDESNDSKEKEN